jgi:serine/threonine-protein kinase
MKDGVPFGEFSLLRKLGAGGMGEVFLARPDGRADLPAQVALKRILPAMSRNEIFCRDFLDEARVACLISHPGVTRAFDVGMSDGLLYLVMEHVDGITLRECEEAAKRRGVRVSWPEVAATGLQLCEALTYAHAAKGPDGKALGLVHRDVTPANVMIDRAGRVKLLDFGIAKATVAYQQTMPGTVWASLRYAAPEVLLGRPADPRTDVYGAAITLYELAAGQPAFDGPIDTLRNLVLHERPPRLSALHADVPVAFADVLDAALAKEPSQRPQSSAALRDALERCLNANGQGATVHALRASLAARIETELATARTEAPRVVPAGTQQLSAAPARAPSLEPPTDIAPRRTFTAEQPTVPAAEPPTLPARTGPLPQPRRSSPFTAILAVAAVAAGAVFIVWRQQQPASHESAAIAPVPVATRQPEAPAPEALPVDAEPPAEPPPEPEPAASPKADPPRSAAVPHAVRRPPDAPPASGPTGALAVTCNVECRVSVDGKSSGPSPFTLKTLSAGTHKVEVISTRGAGVRHEATVRVTAGTRTEKAFTFATGKLRVLAKPWADVTVDGRPAGQTPMAPLELAEGQHDVLLRNSELNAERRESVVVVPGQSQTLSVELK